MGVVRCLVVEPPLHHAGSVAVAGVPRCDGTRCPGARCKPGSGNLERNGATRRAAEKRATPTQKLSWLLAGASCLCGGGTNKIIVSFQPGNVSTVVRSQSAASQHAANHQPLSIVLITPRHQLSLLSSLLLHSIVVFCVQSLSFVCSSLLSSRYLSTIYRYL